MTKTSFRLFSGVMLFLVGAACFLVSWRYATHQQALRQADALALAGNFGAALHAYDAAAAHQGPWDIPPGALLALMRQFGFDTRSYIQLRRAEMTFRQGERLLQAGNASEKPSLDDVLQHFQQAAALYQAARDHTSEPYWQFLASANRARALAQTFLTQAFVAEQPRDPASLKQSLVRAIKALQSALNILYTDQVRVTVVEERSLVLLLETLTRFQRVPEAEVEERRRVEAYFQDTSSSPEMAPFGEILRASDLHAFSPETEETMRTFLLHPRPNPSPAATDHASQGARTGVGSADAGSAGKMH